VRRRLFLASPIVAAASWPQAGSTQPRAAPRIAFLHGNKPDGDAGAVAGINEGLREAGFIDGQNVTFDYRWASNDFSRLPVLAAELVARGPAVIIAGGGSAAAVAAKGATSTIPIVLAFGSDPVELGLAANLDRPGGNITGVILPGQYAAERVKLLTTMAPQVRSIAYLRTGPQHSNAVSEEQAASIAGAARALGRQLVAFKVDDRTGIDAALAAIVDQKIGALDIAAHPFFDDDATIADLAAQTLRYRIPGIFIQEAFPKAGGLMSYGESYAEGFRHAGQYVARILKGEKPADMPFDRTMKVELIINNSTARSFGLAVPPSLAARATLIID
jgi:putative ABC transport system substrate-binding protein